MTAQPLRVCWVDEDWDRSCASDNVSRYGAYLRSHTELFDPWREATDGITEDPGEFVIAAFQVACGPIMSPGYVCWHPRVLDHQVNYGDDPDPTRLICQVTLASFPPRRAYGCAGRSPLPPSPAHNRPPGPASRTCVTPRRQCGRWST